MKSHRRSRNSRQAVVLPLYSEEDENDKEEEHQTFPDAYHPDLSFTLLQRIKINEIISLDLQNRHNFKEDGCRILACALFLNTSIASLDLWGTNISAGASLLIHALAHLRPPNSEPCATHQLLLAHCFMFIKTFRGAPCVTPPSLRFTSLVLRCITYKRFITGLQPLKSNQVRAFLVGGCGCKGHRLTVTVTTQNCFMFIKTRF
jgi:hypothetical protein